MTIPSIIPNKIGNLSFIDTEDYNQNDNETYIFSRERFKETARIISSVRSIDKKDLPDIGRKFAIVAANKNDALITAVAVTQVFVERGIEIGTKIKLYTNDFLIDPGMFALDRDQPYLMNLNLEELHSIIYEADDYSDFFTDENNHGLEFYILSPENADIIPSELMSAVITIGKDTNLSPRTVLTEYFKDRNYNADQCTSVLEAIDKTLADKDEYFITMIARNIINDHLFNNPLDHNLTPRDFRNVPKIKKKPAPRRNSNVRLVGLEEERAKLNSILTEHYISRQRVQLGLAPDTDGCNIVFAGPPGTAKTTLARIYADRLAELGIIKAGNFKECVKSDYIGQFVGQTTPKIEELFREMSERGGGVLFFDEIYTLSENDTTAFDKEAVASIVQNMENYRDKVYCVFAGYEEKMNEFLNCNQGLKSRITNTVRFKGYDDAAIADIFRSMAESQGFKLSGECLPLLKEHFAKLRAVRGEGFGNGREARNLFVNAKQQQAMRIGIKKKPTKKALTNMTLEDIANASRSILSSEFEAAKTMNPIGFNRTQTP